MRCEEIRPRLSALADRELSAAAAWVVRRHLHRCAACASLFADMEQISRAVAGLYSDAAVPDSLLARFIAAAERPVFSTMVQTAPARRGGRAIALATGLVGIFGASAVVVSLCLTSQPKVAFADVEQAMRGFHTVHFHIFRHARNHPYTDRWTLRWEVWGNTDIPAQAELRISGSRRWLTTSSHADVIRFWEGKKCTVVRVHLNPDRNWAQNLRNGIYAACMLPPQQGQSGPFGRGWTWRNGERTSVNSRALIRLKGRCGDETAVLFADPVTHRLVRSEFHEPLGREWVDDVYDFDSYDAVPPPGKFADVRK